LDTDGKAGATAPLDSVGWPVIASIDDAP